MTGLFIVLEGPDGSGTTRHTQWLCERMRSEGYDVLLTSEPTEGSIGKEIRGLLKADRMPPPESVQLLFCADRAQHVREVIEPVLARGQIVVCDRYTLSTIVYGAASGVNREWLAMVNAYFPKPDLTIVTLPPFDVCMDRIGRRDTRDHFEEELFQRQIYEEYQRLEAPDTIFIDTTPDKDIVTDQVWQVVQERLGTELRAKA